MRTLIIQPSNNKMYSVAGFEDFSAEEFADIVCILNQMRMQMQSYDDNLKYLLENHNLFRGEKNSYVK